MEREESRFTNFMKWNPTILYIMFLARHGIEDKGRLLASLNAKDFDAMDTAGVTPTDLIDYTNPRGATPEDDGIIFALWTYFGKKPILFTTGNFMSEDTANEILELIDNIKEFANRIREKYNVNEIDNMIKIHADQLMEELSHEYDIYVCDKGKKVFKLSDKIKHDFTLEHMSGFLLD